MHGAAQWLGFGAIHQGGTLVLQGKPEKFDPAEVLELVAARGLQHPDDGGRRLRAAARRGAAPQAVRPLAALHHRLGRRDPVAAHEGGAARVRAARHGGRRLRRLGDRRARLARHPRRRRRPDRQVRDDEHADPEAGPLRAARAGVGGDRLGGAHRPRAARLLQGSGEDGEDVPDGRRRALRRPRRPRPLQPRRLDQRARPRLGVHQLGRREDLPRGGRAGAAQASRPCTTRWSSARPTSGSASR